MEIALLSHLTPLAWRCFFSLLARSTVSAWQEDDSSLLKTHLVLAETRKCHPVSLVHQQVKGNWDLASWGCWEMVRCLFRWGFSDNAEQEHRKLLCTTRSVARTLVSMSWAGRTDWQWLSRMPLSQPFLEMNLGPSARKAEVLPLSQSLDDISQISISTASRESKPFPLQSMAVVRKPVPPGSKPMLQLQLLQGKCNYPSNVRFHYFAYSGIYVWVAGTYWKATLKSKAGFPL